MMFVIVRSQSELHCRSHYSCQVFGQAGEPRLSDHLYRGTGSGTGKSSSLNVLLDNAPVVPTSSMCTCTAVVTEIRYHKHKHISVQVDFLSRAQWKKEVTVLLEDLRDDDGNTPRVNDLHSEAGVVWHKVWVKYAGNSGIIENSRL